VKYLKKVEHPKWTEVEKLEPTRLNIDWATTGNYKDCGVFLMRHMETWMGVTKDKWDCGFPKTNIKAKVNLLRKKYAAAILLSESNIHRARVLEEAKKLKNSLK